MLKPRKLRMAKIPRNALSKKFLGLHWKKKIAVMKKMRQECIGLNAEMINVADAVKKLNAGLDNYRNFLENGKLEEAKEKLGKLSVARTNLLKKVGEFGVFAKQYLTSYNPHKFIESNPVEVWVHKTWELSREAERYIEKARETVQFIEKLKQKHML
jgi:hypothetical protein